jgi:hypothetical protein
MSTSGRRLVRSLSVFSLAMINIAAMGSIKNWPVNAEFGLASIFYLIAAAVVFFIPLALVSAELATGWPKTGGSSYGSRRRSDIGRASWRYGSCGLKTSFGILRSCRSWPRQSPL